MTKDDEGERGRQNDSFFVDEIYEQPLAKEICPIYVGWWSTHREKILG